jgi:hypothetical protein
VRVPAGDVIDGVRHTGALVNVRPTGVGAPRVPDLFGFDAAISFDPLAAQGILTAMYSGLLAGQAIGPRLHHDGDAIGAYCARLDAIGRASRQERRRYYQQQRRWAGHCYWRRRAGGS